MFMTRHPRLFQIFKYTVYLALALNTFLFFQEEISSMHTVFDNGFEWGLLGEAFSATIDTAAWLVLLLVFELETFVIDDDKLEGPLGMFLKILGLICYAIIIYAFIGYISSLNLIGKFEPVAGQITDYCALVAQGGYEFVETLDEYVALSAENCQALGADSWMNAKANLLASGEAFNQIKILTWIDIINAASWILVVLVLQAEVFFDARARIFTPIKYILYSTLFLCLIAWLIYGDFLDVWDAALWLAAFFFIELNVVAWREEIAERERLEGASS